MAPLPESFPPPLPPVPFALMALLLLQASATAANAARISGELPTNASSPSALHPTE